MIEKRKIVQAIQDLHKKYEGEISDEHITALVELYANTKLKKFKLLVVEEIKDLLEMQVVSQSDIRKILDKILEINLEKV